MANSEAFAFEFEEQLEERERQHRAKQLEASNEERQQTDSADERGGRVRRFSNAFVMESVNGDGAGDALSSVSSRTRMTVAKRPKHTHQVVCRHWLRGMCIKGDSCDFLHIFDPSRMPPCRQYGKHGRCAEHEQGTCPLRHDDMNIATPEGPVAAADMTASRHSSNVVCIQYLFGYCQSGPFCAQRHVRLPLEARPMAALPDWYLQLLLYNRDELEVPPLEESARRESAVAWRAFADQVSAEPSSESTKTLESLLPPQILSPLPSLGPNESPRIRCFVIKSAKIENILTSVQRGIWATGKANIEKFEQAFRTCHYVIFVMSANESGGFQGYARMASLQDPTLYPKIWGSFSAKLSANYRVQWLKQCKVDFEELASFTNPWNENKPLKKSRDGQELPLELAEAICLRLDAAADEDLLIGTPLGTQPRIDHSTFFSLSPEAQQREEIALGLRQPMPAIPAAPQQPLLVLHHSTPPVFIPPPPPPPPNQHLSQIT
eukprot:Blabericola_migrator_1__9951@NODE_54_length_16124_cov_113_894563_g50_i0_p5_GENE_NODE_54_length_16124_cov_113_894563_g50_i0NODE_54_length_16124_cov_113_894563_g50_i0_p5_ORF_typecomplete_len492_score65_62YTH/PF04146_15/7_2e03YTH/PF04146_15/2_9e34Torus/PF16131_5/6_4e07Torus/PF16131_5/0_42zfCCCH_3/PF15663_5/1_4e06zfCCCH_3/PF15663_5/1_6zf_CCCH_4/PF18345_1/1_1e08zf_CCCH_4/PF18345_1/9_5e03zf_CCCH_4/PF18345_1/3_5e03zf_CCCH_4/PF18345_1/8_7e03zfCCCH/PF00642_24/4_7e05zfCCCH/PF00642_24/2_2e02zfCCCH/PF00642_